MRFTVSTVALFTLSFGPVGPAPATGAEKPNIIVILADDLGWMDTGVYGSEYYETPNIDRLARRGMRFTNAYSASPYCSPTRAAIMQSSDVRRLRPPVVNH